MISEPFRVRPNSSKTPRVLPSTPPGATSQRVRGKNVAPDPSVEIPMKSTLVIPRTVPHPPSRITNVSSSVASPRSATKVLQPSSRGVMTGRIATCKEGHDGKASLQSYVPVSSSTRDRVRNLVSDDAAVIADEQFPIATLPFLSTRDSGEAVSWPPHEDVAEELRKESSGDFCRPARCLTAQHHSQAKDLSRRNVSPTRRSGRVILLDEGVGGLLFDEDGMFVLRFDVEDLVLHGSALGIGDVFSYNRVTETESVYRGVRLIRQLTAKEAAVKKELAVKSLEKSESMFGSFDECDNESPSLLKRDHGGGWGDVSAAMCLIDVAAENNNSVVSRPKPRKQSQLVGLEYRTLLTRGSVDVSQEVASLDLAESMCAGQQDSSESAMRRILHGTSTTGTAAQCLLKKILRHPRLLMEDVEQELDDTSLWDPRSGGGCYSNKGEESIAPTRSIFSETRLRASENELKRFLNRTSCAVSENGPACIKRSYGRKWYLPPQSWNDHERMQHGLEVGCEDSEEVGCTVNGDGFDDENGGIDEWGSGSPAKREKGGVVGLIKLSSRQFEVERNNKICRGSTNVRRLVVGVDLGGATSE